MRRALCSIVFATLCTIVHRTTAQNRQLLATIAAHESTIARLAAELQSTSLRRVPTNRAVSRMRCTNHD
jgi:hypothetical protein